jgi:hypothetical protein
MMFGRARVRREPFGIHTRRDDFNAIVVPSRKLGEKGIANYNQITHSANRSRLSWKLEPAQEAVGVGRVEQMNRIIEVEDDWPAGHADSPFEDPRTCEKGGPMYQNNVVPTKAS